jgi:hypothetical protein
MALSKTIICALSAGFLLAACSSRPPDNPMKDAQAACSGVAPATDAPPQTPYPLCLQTYLSARSNVPEFQLTYVDKTVTLARQYDAGQLTRLEWQALMRSAVRDAATAAGGK